MIEYGVDHSIRHRWAHGGRACPCPRAISDPGPHLEDGVPLVRIAQENHLGVRTVYRWAENYRERGLAGLSRKARGDKSKRQMSPTLEKVIEGLAPKEPRPTAAAVHRQAAEVASQLNEPVPSYRTVHLMIQGMDPALVTLAHEGTKSYSDRFDLVHRREAERPTRLASGSQRARRLRERW